MDKKTNPHNWEQHQQPIWSLNVPKSRLAADYEPERKPEDPLALANKLLLELVR